MWRAELLTIVKYRHERWKKWWWWWFHFHLEIIITDGAKKYFVLCLKWMDHHALGVTKVGEKCLLRHFSFSKREKNSDLIYTAGNMWYSVCVCVWRCHRNADIASTLVCVCFTQQLSWWQWFDIPTHLKCCLWPIQ